jgi:signal transduction histidine kinase
MEAIGQLTGGVAHDFNNLLTVITGNLEMIADEIESDIELSAMTASAIRAAERGASLTQRLLAFSRKQVPQPKAIAVDTLVSEMMDILRRALGATISIEARQPAMSG